MTGAHPIFPAFSRTDAAARVPVKVISYGTHSDQVIEIYGSNNEAQATLVLLHGGYWRELFDCEHIRPLGVTLAESGWQVAIPEFRRVAGSPGVSLDDLKIALRKIAGPLTLIGYSSGGHLALLLAAENPNIKKIIALAPVTDMVESQLRELGRGAVHEWLGCDAAERPDLNPNLLPVPQLPIIFIHGDKDERVPIELSENFYTKAEAEGHPITLKKLAGVSHFEMMDIPSPTFAAIVAALN